MVAAERGRAPSEAVERTPEGRPRVTTTTPGGEVTVVVVAEGETTAEALVALHQSVQARIGTLLDARRRASRRDMDPAGQIVVHLTIARGGVGRGRSLSSTVQDSTASGRVVTALTGAARGLRAAAGSYRVTVTFAGN